MTDTLVLRALAALLIANSHIEDYYPLRQLAADGLLGDSLFFFLSGFGLALSAERTDRRFVDWYGRRVARIYPSLLLAVFLFDFIGQSGWMTWSWSDYVLNVAWGRRYGFVGQVMTLYVALYWALRGGPRRLPRLFALLCLPYAAGPLLGRGDAVFHGLHWAYYFQQMLLGAWVARRTDTLRPAGPRAWAALAALAAAYVAARLGVARVGSLADWFFLPHLLAFPMVYLLLRAARAERLAALLQGHRRAERAIALVGGASLEVYLVHYQVFPRPEIASLAFPLNVVAFLAASLALAWLLSVASTRLRGLPGRRAPVLPALPGVRLAEAG